MAHFIEYCKSCGVIINQCRCADPNKEKYYGICAKCKCSTCSGKGIDVTLGQVGTCNTCGGTGIHIGENK